MWLTDKYNLKIGEIIETNMDAEFVRTRIVVGKIVEINNRSIIISSYDGEMEGRDIYKLQKIEYENARRSWVIRDPQESNQGKVILRRLNKKYLINMLKEYEETIRRDDRSGKGIDEGGQDAGR